jgi:3-hydroxymyristoyl/3-hydroxydecanoyl-(acyl carrier protein) dehydratase
MSDMSSVHTTSIRIAASHPSLPGHFPGQPIVPGVVLLDRVLSEAERWLQHSVRPASLPNAKFTAPLLPEQDAELQLKLDGEELRFSLSRNGSSIAQGSFRLLGEQAA